VKNDKLYNLYLDYLNFKLLKKQLTNNKYLFLKMSLSYFNDFKNKFENNETFKKKIIEVYRIEVRDKKINKIFETD
jgi:hypothetical protein